MSRSGSDLAERITDLLRAPGASSIRAAAENAGDEATRADLRAIALPYLAEASAEIDREIAARLGHGEATRARLEVALAFAERPTDRVTLGRRWRDRQEEVAGLRAARSDVRDDAARAAGAEDAVAWLAAAAAVDPSGVLDRFERVAFEPLDERIARAARSRMRFVQGSDSDVWDDATSRCLAAHSDNLPPSAIPPILRRIGACLSFDPDAGTGPEVTLVDPGDRPFAAVFPWASERPRVALPSDRGGPGGVRDGLAAFGRGCRLAVVRRLRGEAAALGADPAFEVAAEVLFRRLPLSREFAAWAGIAAFDAWSADARFEEAIEPRVDGAALALAGVPVSRLPEAAREAFRRAAGRSPSPGRDTRWWARDPRAADRLRGTVLGLLVEERLLVRYGHGWFADARAGRWLHEVWEAEPGETAESMAGSMTVGRIEPTPVFDRCRP